MIRISALPLITDKDQFLAAQQILLVDILNVGDSPRVMREYIKANHGGFVYNKQTYMPITLSGNPESLIKNAEKGILFKFDNGFQNLYSLEPNLDAIIWHKKLYDLSAFMGQSDIRFEQEVDFITERYLVGYQPYPEIGDSLLKVPSTLPAIGKKAMTGLKLVKK